jgi:hypothetical protein
MAIFPTGSSRAGSDICKILGLDSSRTRSLTIEIQPDKLITVHATVYPDSGQWQEIEDRFTEEMKTYQLVEVKNTEQENLND